MAIVRHRTGQFSKSSVDSRKQRARERASKLNQKPVVACDRAKVENKVDKFQGCRIIDLKYLISQLEDGCSLCGEVLHLVNLENETRHGLASLFLHQVLLWKHRGSVYKPTSRKCGCQRKKYV